MAHLLGVAVEIPMVQLAILDLNGRVVAEQQGQLDSRDTLESLKRLTTQFRDVAPSVNLKGCGLAFSGFINQQRGLSLATPRLEAWQDVPVSDIFRQHLGLSTILNHHMDALALAECTYGAARQWDDFIFFDVGYGLGVRLAQDGGTLDGTFGNAGLIGHTTVVPDGRQCLCGNKGCLEEYVSERALFRALGKEMENDPSADKVAQDLFTRSDRGDPRAADIVDEIIAFLAIGVANTINIFDTPHVVLGGFLNVGGAALHSRLIGEVKARLQPVLANATRIVFSDLPRASAASRGAALYALKHYLPFIDPLVADTAKEVA